eukprot:SAG22_NODE_3548_length_1649_cov_3.999355_3_plen_64_part_00
MLRPRVAELLAANPWLAGSLAKDPGGGVAVVHPPAVGPTDAVVDKFMVVDATAVVSPLPTTRR